ncbi:hypothetical protein T265_06403 [Opisthorchis viverrini]|uniref:Uncharacterized protein n=1 Tax=Opisthorchis viverrini TaxID=6198 RepID=A0A074ZGM1_OPIVI|nr:hypothetical protein T265_06403 [Opisthorchis viverrini]KER26358.1 hypothetical protein T265_06403 [Opisthorchis viverrini]
MLSEVRTRAEILSGCPSLDRRFRSNHGSSDYLKELEICTKASIPTSPSERIIIIMDSMTPVFNTDASLPYNRDLLERLIVKKRVKVKGWSPLLPPLLVGLGKQHSSANDGWAYATRPKNQKHMSQPTQLLVPDTFFNGDTRCTTENSLSNCLVTDTPIPAHTSYGSEITIVEHLKTSQFRCSKSPILIFIRENNPHCSLIHTSLQIQG